MRRTIRFLTTAGMLLVAASAAAEGFKIVVNEKSDVSTLTRKEVSALLMKKTMRWSNGTNVFPVDQAPGSAVRDRISTQIHGKRTAAVKSYWQQQIFSGRAIPPVEKASDTEVVALVRANAGAIGYVSDSASTAGVKVVTIP